MIRRNLYILFFLIPFLICAQGIDINTVKNINREAIRLNREGEFEKAKGILEDLLQRLEDENSELKYKAITWQTLAKVIMNMGDYQESFRLARKSLAYGISAPDSLNMADNLNTIGINHYFLSDYDSTTYYYEKSLKIKRKLSTDPYSLAVSEYNLGIVYEDLGMPDRALELYHAAERDLLQSGAENTFLSDVYVGITHIHFYAGETDTAEIYAEKALQEGLQTYGEDNPNITFIYTSYSNILEYQQRYKESIELLEKSLEIRRKRYGENHRWTCESYYDLATVYRLDGQTDRAEELYKKAIDIGQMTQSRQYLAYAKTYLAGLYLDEEKNLEEAEKLLMSSLKDQLDIFGQKNEVVSENYSRLAKLEMIRKDEGAFFINIEKSLFSSNYDKYSIQKVIAPYHALETLMLLGDWHQVRFEETLDFSHLIKAFELLDEELLLIKHVQRNFSTDRSKINLANEYRKTFETGMNLCWELFEQTGDQIYVEKAFDLSEANRNAALLSGLQEIQHRLLSDLPETLIQFEKILKNELEKVKMDLYYEKAAEKPDKEFLADLMNRRIQLTSSLDSLYDSFSLNYPGYKDLKNQDYEIDIMDVKTQLDSESQLLTYFLGEDMLYSFAITNDTVRFLRDDVSKVVLEKTNDFRTRLTERREVLEVAQDLYRHLGEEQIDPTRKNLILVPDNVLSYVPFEILTDEKERHLIDDYNISYSGGARIFLELKNEFFNSKYENKWVGFAPGYKEDLQLSSNEDEIRLIAERFGGDTFLGERASRENFLANNRNYSILHLAMHAEMDNANPMYNRLIFADGELTSAEIYLSESKANLAVLSACNTGFGKLEKGEGVMSMARAFHFSGVPAVVMSLWKVPDRETKQIMLHFYDHLKKGQSKGEALRRAKLDYLRETEDLALRHPYYWAGFVINGNTEALELQNNTNYLIMGLAAALLLVVGLLMFARKRMDIKRSLQKA